LNQFGSAILIRYGKQQEVRQDLLQIMQHWSSG